MSETVHYKGTAVLISKGEQAEIDAKIILAERGEELHKFYTSCVEQLCAEYYEEYFYHNKTKSLYEIEHTEYDLEEEILEAKYIGFDNSQIAFELRYYNGGAGFEECLEEAMDKLNK